MTRNAAAISALELIRAASDVLAVGSELVIAVGTVVIAIADPTVVQAGDTILALILVRLADTLHWSGAVLKEREREGERRVNEIACLRAQFI